MCMCVRIGSTGQQRDSCNTNNNDTGAGGCRGTIIIDRGTYARVCTTNYRSRRYCTRMLYVTRVIVMAKRHVAKSYPRLGVRYPKNGRCGFGPPSPSMNRGNPDSRFPTLSGRRTASHRDVTRPRNETAASSNSVPVRSTTL